jgi:arylformamidase
VKTGTSLDRERFTGDFAGLDPSLAPELAARGVVLVGIDTPSVDPYEDEAFEAHRALARARVTWLEGLVLADVAPGHYDLVALPLRIEGGDGSPVRAVLVAP